MILFKLQPVQLLMLGLSCTGFTGTVCSSKGRADRQLLAMKQKQGILFRFLTLEITSVRVPHLNYYPRTRGSTCSAMGEKDPHFTLWKLFLLHSQLLWGWRQSSYVSMWPGACRGTACRHTGAPQKPDKAAAHVNQLVSQQSLCQESSRHSCGTMVTAQQKGH